VRAARPSHSPPLSITIMPAIAIISAAIPIIAEAIAAGRTILTADDLTVEEIERIRADAKATHDEFDAYVAQRLGRSKQVRT